LVKSNLLADTLLYLKGCSDKITSSIFKKRDKERERLRVQYNGELALRQECEPHCAGVPASRPRYHHSALEEKTEDDSVPYLTSTAVVSAECQAHPEPVLELLLVKREEMRAKA
jgi:hypothetical protein